MKILKKNKKASFNYFLLKRYTAGLILLGPEVKAIKEGLINIEESFVREKDGDLYLWNAYVTSSKGIYGDINPNREKKILLHKREIEELRVNINQKGLTTVPTLLGIENGLVKIEIAVAKGKKTYDKRDSEKAKTTTRILRNYMLKETRGV